MNPRRLLLSWSSGKDSAWCLHVLRQAADFEIVGFFTTFNAAHDRVAIHGVRRDLVEAQGAAAGLPVHWIPLTDQCTNQEYEASMRAFSASAIAQGISHFAFGDLFLQDIRDYRERLFAGTGIKPVFPLWKLETAALAAEMVSAGVRGYLTCIDMRKLGREFAGRRYDFDLLRDLPPDVDPCGENGEFHTFCCDGPMFDRPIAVQSGHNVQRNEFVFTDLVPVSAW